MLHEYEHITTIGLSAPTIKITWKLPVFLPHSIFKQTLKWKASSESCQESYFQCKHPYLLAENLANGQFYKDTP